MSNNESVLDNKVNNITVKRNGRIGGRTWKYSILEKPNDAMYTNYHVKEEKVIWYFVGDDRWEFEQYKKSQNIVHYIPGVNFGSNVEYYRKYKVFKNGKCTGEINQHEDMGVRRHKLTLDNQVYFVKAGNTGFICPKEIYQWTIEDANKNVIASIKDRRETSSERGVYTIDSNGDLDIDIIAMQVMMFDMISIMKPGNKKGVARPKGI